MTDPSRRRWLAAGCAHCLAFAAGGAWAQTAPPAWTLPARFTRPDVASDEGGLWAIMDREEARLRRGSFVLRDPALRQYLADIVCRLGDGHCQDTRVYAVRTPIFNAAMAPNGMMQVWTGLLLRVENEAQLAAVLGHELGHYLQRHSIDRMRQAKGSSAFMTMMASFGLVGLVGQFAAIAGYMSYERDHEREADRIGITLMRRGGYDTREAAKVWKHLRAELSAGQGGDPAGRSVLFASHPGIEEREGTLEQLGADGSGVVGADEYRQRIDPLLWPMLEDELQRAQYDETLVLLDRLVAARPAHGPLRYFRGETRRLRAAADDAAPAQADFTAALAAPNPPAPAHRSLGLLWRQQGRPAEARDAFQRYVDAAPDAPDAAIVKSFITELTS